MNMSNKQNYENTAYGLIPEIYMWSWTYQPTFKHDEVNKYTMSLYN